METSGARVGGTIQKTVPKSGIGDQLSPEHYLRLLMHRKWLILIVFVVVSTATVIVSSRIPDTFTSETLILVDPQKVPEAYVKSTVTGDVRNRLGTLSQQILSATRLQKIIESLNLYPEDRKSMAREDVINRMRADISVSVVSDFGGSQDLEAFKIGYSGREPRLVAQVTNQLASLFIEENLKAREQQATGTTEFLENQLQETRKALETQEAKLRDFKLKHIGEMPEQQAPDLQILGQLQAQMQQEADALSRAEQQKGYIQSMLASGPSVVDLDDGTERPASSTEVKSAILSGPSKQAVNPSKAKLDGLLARYTENHPDVQKLKSQIEEEEAKQALSSKADVQTPATTPIPIPPTAPSAVVKRQSPPANRLNPVLQSQLSALEAEIVKHTEERQRLSKSISNYRAKLDAIPVREQEITQLVRDYEMSKAHYSQLLEKQLSAETATQLEIRQKGEKFEILDPAQVPERPSRPNRRLINAGGAVAGLGLGLLLALVTEFLGMSITTAQDVTAATGLRVLEVIPIIQTGADRRTQKRWVVLAAAGVLVLVLVSVAILVYLSHPDVISQFRPA